MANFTKQAIRASFLKLLNERPLGKISVRDIVEDCGINRNSFYYHYQDIPSLIEEIVTGFFDGLMKEYTDFSNPEAALLQAIAAAQENRRALLHIYNSVSRESFEKYLLRFCRYAVDGYTAAIATFGTLPEEDGAMIRRLLTCELFGIYLEWLQSGAPEGTEQTRKRMMFLCHGLTERMMENSRIGAEKNYIAF